MVGVDEIEPDRLVPQKNLARTRLGNVHLFQLQNFGPPGPVDADGLHSPSLLPWTISPMAVTSGSHSSSSSGMIRTSRTAALPISAM